METFKRLNEKAPNQMEIQAMVNKLLLPIVVKQPGMLWDTNTEGFMFEAGSRPDASTVDVAVEYADIPVDLRRGISIDLERELGRKPSEDEVVMRYEDFVFGRGPTPIPERVPYDYENALPNRLLRPFAYLPAKALGLAGDKLQEFRDPAAFPHR